MQGLRRLLVENAKRSFIQDTFELHDKELAGIKMENERQKKYDELLMDKILCVEKAGIQTAKDNKDEQAKVNFSFQR